MQNTNTDDRIKEIRKPHFGMPPLDQSGRQISFFEFWPQHFFYTPMCLYWLWLALRHGGFTLPTIANPKFPFGGWIGESKSAVLDTAGPLARQFIANWCCIDIVTDPSTAAIVETANVANIRFPFIVKPDLGCRGAGVRRIKDASELNTYVSQYPRHERIVIQSLIDHEAEAGIFYVRKPSEPKGRIISLTLKYFPYVWGNGVSTLRELILEDPRAGKLSHIYLPRHEARLDWVVPKGQPFRIAYAGSHSRGTIFRNGNHLITDKMTETFDAIAKDVNEFYFGRFDVRAESIASLQRGEDFKIIEINGAGAEATHIWDRSMTLASAYSALMQQYRLLWQIGAENAARGFKPSTLRSLVDAYRHETKLWAQYPLTE